MYFHRVLRLRQQHARPSPKGAGGNQGRVRRIRGGAQSGAIGGLRLLGRMLRARGEENRNAEHRQKLREPRKFVRGACAQHCGLQDEIRGGRGKLQEREIDAGGNRKVPAARARKNQIRRNADFANARKSRAKPREQLSGQARIRIRPVRVLWRAIRPRRRRARTHFDARKHLRRDPENRGNRPRPEARRRLRREARKAQRRKRRENRRG